MPTPGSARSPSPEPQPDPARKFWRTGRTPLSRRPCTPTTRTTPKKIHIGYFKITVRPLRKIKVRDSTEEGMLRQAINNIATFAGGVVSGNFVTTDLREVLDGQMEDLRSMYDAVAAKNARRRLNGS